ncbi:MAG: STM4013/SEN3800 family hydrolase [Pseudomonadota bacterium]|nr:STM4013/SEN3800 family hydrolase [Pseudomonadota bacterium]
MVNALGGIGDGAPIGVPESATRVDFRAAFLARDLLLLTLDALRYDVAADALAAGHTPNLAALLRRGWEARHTPGTFTLPAHEAFFAGFFPTPPTPGPHPRPIALRFPGSRTIGRDTLLLDGPCLIGAYARAGYHTICIGGTGFFDPGSPLGAILPARFHEAHWSQAMGVTSRRASATQMTLAAARLAALPPGKRALLFLNAAATHPPTRLFLRGARTESVATQAAALADLDRHLPVLLDALRARGGAVGIVCGDHGTCFGEDGYVGHRVAHPLVWTVPYAEVEVAP